MRNLVLRFLINAVAIGVITSGLLPGIFIIGNQVQTIAVVAVVLGVVNALIKPVVKLLSCPLVLITLGLFTFVINGAMLYLASRLSDFAGNVTRGRLVIEHFGWAVVGALIVSVIDMALEWVLIRNTPKQEIIVRYPPDVPPTAPRTGVDLIDDYDPNTGKMKK
jgi:putative membrane protein